VRVEDSAHTEHLSACGRLKRMGFVVYGDTASPIVPLMLYNPAKIPYAAHACVHVHVCVLTCA
jgi:7-keto-8-aminopelargonate synthetase-like enzyme